MERGQEKLERLRSRIRTAQARRNPSVSQSSPTTQASPAIPTLNIAAQRNSFYTPEDPNRNVPPGAGGRNDGINRFYTPEDPNRYVPPGTSRRTLGGNDAVAPVLDIPSSAPFNRLLEKRYDDLFPGREQFPINVPTTPVPGQGRTLGGNDAVAPIIDIPSQKPPMPDGGIIEKQYEDRFNAKPFPEEVNKKIPTEKYQIGVPERSFGSRDKVDVPERSFGNRDKIDIPEKSMGQRKDTDSFLSKADSLLSDLKRSKATQRNEKDPFRGAANSRDPLRSGGGNQDPFGSSF